MAIGPLNYTAITLFVFSAQWSKTSFAITLLKITEGYTKAFVWFILVSLNIFMGLSAILNWVQCSPPSKLWLFTEEGTCWDPNITLRYAIFATVYSAVGDIVLALLPWRLVSKIKISTTEKIGVGIAMSMGVL
jgi:hypothetical protein